jgi:hypothetical protein
MNLSIEIKAAYILEKLVSSVTTQQSTMSMLFVYLLAG